MLGRDGGAGYKRKRLKVKVEGACWACVGTGCAGLGKRRNTRRGQRLTWGLCTV